MTVAFVLISVDVGAEEDVVKKLRKLSNVKEAYATYGDYDVILKVEARSLKELKENVSTKIRRMEKVRSTWTMIVAHGFPEA